MWESASRMISCPGRVWVSTETRLPWVPEETKSAASLPERRAASSSRLRTVGSSCQTSSPTSARAIASLMAGVGRVRVSERRSTMSCMGLPRSRGLEPLGRAAAPFGIGVFGSHPPEGLLGLLGAAVARVHLTETVERLRDHEGARIVLDHVLQPLAGGCRVALVDVIAGHPQLLLGHPPPADVDLGQSVGGVAALRVLPDQTLEGFHRLLRDALVLLHGLHLVVVAHGQPELHEVGDLMAWIEREEGLELLDGLVPFALPIIGFPAEETGARSVRRLGVPLDDLLERRARVLVAVPVQLLLALRVEIGGGQQRLRTLLEVVGHGRTPSEEDEQRHQRRGNRGEVETHQQVVGFQSRSVLRREARKVKDIAAASPRPRAARVAFRLTGLQVPGAAKRQQTGLARSPAWPLTARSLTRRLREVMAGVYPHSDDSDGSTGTDCEPPGVPRRPRRPRRGLGGRRPGRS